METNILGLPSLTGYTPLKAAQEGQVLKYDFKGIGPIVMDKSGNGNRGWLKPREDPPRRKIVSWFPLEVAMAFDGKNDYIDVGQPSSLDFTGENVFTLEAEVKWDGSNIGSNKDIIHLGDYEVILSNNAREKWTIYFHDGVTGHRDQLDASDDVDSRVRLRGVYDGKELTLYRNGEPSGTPESTSKTVQDRPGMNCIGTHVGEDRPFSGKIYKVSVYNQAVPP